MVTFLKRQGQHSTHLFHKEGVSFDSNVGQSKAPILVAVLQLVQLQPLKMNLLKLDSISFLYLLERGRTLLETFHNYVPSLLQSLLIGRADGEALDHLQHHRVQPCINRLGHDPVITN